MSMLSQCGKFGEYLALLRIWRNTLHFLREKPVVFRRTAFAEAPGLPLAHNHTENTRDGIPVHAGSPAAVFAVCGFGCSARLLQFHRLALFETVTAEVTAVYLAIDDAANMAGGFPFVAGIAEFDSLVRHNELRSHSFLPMIERKGTGPICRLSCALYRLSPMTKNWSAGIVSDTSGGRNSGDRSKATS